MRDYLERLLELTRFYELGYAVIELTDREGELHTGSFYSEDINELLEEIHEELNNVSIKDVEFEMDFDSDILTTDDEEEGDE